MNIWKHFNDSQNKDKWCIVTGSLSKKEISYKLANITFLDISMIKHDIGGNPNDNLAGMYIMEFYKRIPMQKNKKSSPPWSCTLT